MPAREAANSSPRPRNRAAPWQRKHFKVAALYLPDSLSVDPYAMDVGQVVGAVLLPAWQMLKQLGGKMLVWGEGFNRHFWDIPSAHGRIKGSIPIHFFTGW